MINDKAHLFTPGTIFIIRPDVVHTFPPSTAEPFHMLNVHFDLAERPNSRRTVFSRLWTKSSLRRKLEILSEHPRTDSFLPIYRQLNHAATYERLFQGMLNLFPDAQDPARGLRLRLDDVAKHRHR